MAWPMVAMAAASIVGGVMANRAAKNGREAQQAALAAAMAELEKVGMPPDLSRRVLLQEFQSQGIYEPDIAEDIDLAASAISPKLAPETSKARPVRCTSLPFAVGGPTIHPCSISFADLSYGSVIFV